MFGKQIDGGEMIKLEKLFQPAKIGSVEITNRIIMTAVSTRYDYEESDRLSRFYAERAKGGVGLIITGALQTIYPGRKTGTGRISLYNDSGIPKLKEWVKAIHEIRETLSQQCYIGVIGMQDAGMVFVLAVKNSTYKLYLCYREDDIP